MITYNWDITKLVTTGDNNTVKQIHWSVYATEGDVTSPTISKFVDLPEPDENAFIEYPDITKEIAKTWLFDIMSEDEKTWWEETCVDNIEKAKRQSSSLQLPWS